MGYDGVGRVPGRRLHAGAVRRRGFDRGDECLVEEELADVRDGAAGDGVVGEEDGVEVGENWVGC